MLITLEICDIYHLKAHTCSFEKLYYKYGFDSDENTIRQYNDLYFMKIPR